MTRHDPLVQTAAPHRGPTGWFVPGATVTMIMHANLTDAVVVDARMQFELLRVKQGETQRQSG